MKITSRAIKVGVVILILGVVLGVVLIAIVYLYSQVLVAKRNQDRVDLATHLGLASSATWADIQQHIYCQIANIGRERRDVELDLSNIGVLDITTADMILYSFRDPELGDHVALYVSYDNETYSATVTKRILL